MSTQDLGQYSAAVRQNGITLDANEPFTANGTTTLNGLIYANNVISFGGLSQGGAPQVLATTGTITLTTATLVNVLLQTTPTGNITLNMPVPSGGGQYVDLEVITSGATSYTITFGTNILSQGVLRTGIVSGVTYMVQFESDGTNWVEVGRVASNTGGALLPVAGSTAFHTGGVGVVATTGLAQTQVVSTDSYFAEVFIPANTVVTGISVLNGHTVSASQNTFVGLANASGVIVASSATNVAQGTADTFQQIPFTAAYQAVGPNKYYVVVQGSNTTGYFATHTIGNFGATLKTSETYGTFVTTASYSTTTFTTARGPVADTY